LSDYVDDILFKSKSENNTLGPTKVIAEVGCMSKTTINPVAKQKRRNGTDTYNA